MQRKRGGEEHLQWMTGKTDEKWKMDKIWQHDDDGWIEPKMDGDMTFHEVCPILGNLPPYPPDNESEYCCIEFGLIGYIA